MSDEADTFWGRCTRNTEQEIAESPFVYDHKLPQPHWRDDNTCSHCGGLRPSLALEAIRAGAEVEPTDKNYKIYVKVPDPKVGQMRVVSVRNFAPKDFDPVKEGWIPADPVVLKASGWGTDSDAKWMQLEPHRALMTAKCYLNHFSEAQAVEFVRLNETGAMKLAHPGYFYSGMCFGVYRAAIEAMVKTLPPKAPKAPEAPAAPEPPAAPEAPTA